MKLARCLLLLACLMAVSCPAWAEDLKVEASLDRNVISMGEVAKLQVTIRGDQGQGNPDLRIDLPDFLVQEAARSQNMMIVNGVMSGSLSITYLLVPRKPGRFTIPAIRIESGGRRAASEPIPLEVLQGAAASRPPRVAIPRGAVTVPLPRSLPRPGTRPAPPGTSGRGPAFLTAEVVNPHPYVGEAVTYRIRFYHVEGASPVGDLQYPDLTGFFKEDLPPEKRWSTMIDGVPYLVNELDIALFPTSDGARDLGPARLNCRIPTRPLPGMPGQLPGPDEDWDFLMGVMTEQTLESPTVHLDVRPLPKEGCPDDFTGAVGEYRLESRLDPATGARVGQPLTLELKVTGRGNVHLIQAPRLPSLPGFRVYDPVTSTATSREKGAVTGTATFKIALVPTKAGMLEMPEITLSCFDPTRGEYRRLSVPPRQVAVGPGQTPAASSGEQVPAASEGDLRPLHPTLGPEGSPPLAGARWFWMTQGVPLAIILAALLAWGPRLRLPRRAPGAGSALKRARARLRRVPASRALAEVPSILYAYLGEKMSTPVIGLRTEDLLQRLRERGMADDDAASLARLLALSEQARFAPLQPEPAAPSSPAAEAEHLLARLERSLR